MDENRIEKSTNRWLICIIIILVLVIIGLTRYLVYQNTLFNKAFIYETNAMYKQTENDSVKNSNNLKDNSNIINNNVTSSVPKVKSFSLELTSDEGKEKMYTLDDDYSVHSKIVKVDEIMVEYSFTINDSDYEYRDFDWFNAETNSITLKFYKLGKYLAFENTGTTDIRSNSLYIFDKSGNLYNQIYSFDDNDKIEKINDEDYMYDMVLEEVDYKEDSFTITTTRINHGPSIIYNGKMYEGKLNRGEEGRAEASSIPKDLPIKKQYKFIIDNEGNISFDDPEVTILETYQDFLNEFPEFIN